MHTLPHWRSTDHTEKCRRKPGRMAEGLRRHTQKFPQSRILEHECVCGFESDSCQTTFWTRWGRAFSRQILSHWNVNWRWQSKAKNKKFAMSSVVDNRAVWNSTKKGTQTRHVKHECTRWFERKSFHMDNTNRLADYISEMQILPNWKSAYLTKKCRRKSGRMAEGLRRQTQEIPQSRILVHECVRGFQSDSCQKSFWTRWGRAFSWQILSHWNVNWRWQSKAKKNKKTQRRLWLITERFETAQKKGTQTRHVKHECTRGFKRKSLQMDDTNRLAD